MKKPIFTYKNQFFLILFSLLILLFFFNRGFLPYDEGYILHSAQRILMGEKIYKDFNFIYTPGSVFLTAFSFKVLGESILSGRVLMLLITLTSTLILYNLVVKITQKPFLGLLAAFTYLSWGPSHINFPSPTMFALFGALTTYYFFIFALNEKSPLYYFLAGLGTASIFLFKQNFGFAALINSLIIFLSKKEIRSLKFFLSHLFGFVFLMAAFLIYLLSTNSFIPFLIDFYTFSVKKIILQGLLNTPFLYEEGFKKMLKALFYLIPFFVPLFTLAKAFIKRLKAPKYLFLSSFCLLFFLVGIRPVTDFVHLAPLLALTGIPLAIAISQSEKQILKILGCIFSLALIILGFYTALFKGYFRWETPLIKQNKFLADSRIKIYVDNKYYLLIPQLSSFISQLSADDDHIFVFYYAPMFYFITDKKNPTRYSDFSPALSTKEEELEALKKLKKAQVNAVLLHFPVKLKRKSSIVEYIQQNYRPVEQLSQYSLWQKIKGF